MEKGLLASSPEPCPEEFEEPDLEDDPDFEALCADDKVPDRENAATNDVVMRRDDRFIPVALFLLLAILTAPRERGQQSKIQLGFH
jgi:hypothetical protein